MLRNINALIYHTFVIMFAFFFKWLNATDTSRSSSLAALDYYMDRGEQIDDNNYGWPLPLEFDEYPIEIQCPLCFYMFELIFLF